MPSLTLKYLHWYFVAYAEGLRFYIRMKFWYVYKTKTIFRWPRFKAPYMCYLETGQEQGGRTDKCMGGRGRLRELICDSVMRGKPTQVLRLLAVSLCIFVLHVSLQLWIHYCASQVKKTHRHFEFMFSYSLPHKLSCWQEALWRAR